MPVYTFKCQPCGKEFENFFQYQELLTDGSPIVKPVCPKCKSTQTRKTIKVAPTVIYNGDGFTLKKKE